MIDKKTIIVSSCNRSWSPRRYVATALSNMVDLLVEAIFFNSWQYDVIHYQQD